MRWRIYKRSVVDEVLAELRSQSERDLICPDCGRITRRKALRTETHFLCDECTLRIGRAFLDALGVTRKERKP